ncbi:MAG: hypothetical protein MMC23_001283 [Stictis urceolatum]|nr:hypothetical protein [Stictis urceolata]
MAMNLGNANLKYVNTNKPQLQHSGSQRSATASDDYYSLSEKSAENSELNSSDEKTTVIRYQTPPQGHSRSGSYQDLHSGHSRQRSGHDLPSTLSTHQEASSPPPASPASPTSPTSPSIRYSVFPGVKRKATPPSPPQVPQKDIRPVKSEDEIVQLPPVGPRSSVRFTKQAIGQQEASANMKAWRASQSGVRAPTPGVDDTPYIQFAIDQLTRDEEALGRSRDQTGSPDIAPVSPLLTVSESQRLRKERDGQRMKENRTPEPVVLPQRRESLEPISDEAREKEHILVPARPPQDMHRYPPLTFIPKSLRLVATGMLCLACVAPIALLVASMVYSSQKSGLWDYDGVGTGRYFLAEYLPQLLAVIILIWLQIVQAAIQRILPFVLLAKPSQNPRHDIISTVPLYVTNYLLPNKSMLQKGEFTLAYSALSIWATLFTVPLSSALFQTRLYTSQWKWATVQPIAIILIALYANLILSLLTLHLRLRRSPTGLKWDPVSLADVLVLLRRSSALSSPRNSHLPSYIGSRPASLGYWESTSHPGAFFHGIGASHSPTRLHLEDGKAVAAPNPTTLPSHPPQTSTFESWASAKHAHSRPAYLRPTYLILYACISTVLLLAFLLAAYIHAPLLSGFAPLLPTATRATASYSTFSPSNFLYSFLPALLGLLLPLLWAPMDSAARFLAPYATLARAGRRGTGAEKSLLLSYNADGPGAVLTGVANGHFAVAGSAALGLVAWVVPVLAGGIFTAQFVRGEGEGNQGAIEMRAERMGLGALSAFLVVVALGWVVAWPVARRALGAGSAGPGVGGGKKGRVSWRSSRSTASGKDLEKGGVGEERTSAEMWLGEKDVRTLAGVRDVAGEEILGLRVWREPRGRTDLVGRLVGRGRGRWSWGGDGVERVGV